MKILITGATGLIGKALEPELRKEGHDVVRLVRQRNTTGCCDFYWNPASEELEPAALLGLDAVIHLSGENIASRWTEIRKRAIHDSRVKSTSFLSKTISVHETPPKTLICASAIGYYGDRGDEILTETSKFGTGFLADTVRQWEAATTPASVKGIRVVNMRFGMVLSAKGGALAKMLPAFKFGGGGIVGSGNQYWSWATIDDVVGAIQHALKTESLEGPVNVVSPEPATNRGFTRILSSVLSRPAVLPMPAFAAKLAFGEMAEQLLLASARVEPAQLLASGYEFGHSELEGALRHLLKKD